MNAYFAGGCFWCITPVMKLLDGVLDVRSGYCGGDEANPTYEQVKNQQTGHRETIKIEYDESVISYEKLLRSFLAGVDVHDGEGQFIDKGHSYTLAVYYETPEEKAVIYNVLGEYSEKIHVAVEELKAFYEAEEYHQNYYVKHPEEFEAELISSGRTKMTAKELIEKANNYYYGEGEEMDLEKAASLYKEAAEQGDAEGLCLYGYCLRNGIGIEQNAREAFKLFAQSAEIGFPMAMYNIGYCYDHGIGAEKDPELAKIWYQKAEENGYYELVRF